MSLKFITSLIITITRTIMTVIPMNITITKTIHLKALLLAQVPTQLPNLPPLTMKSTWHLLQAMTTMATTMVLPIITTQCILSPNIRPALRVTTSTISVIQVDTTPVCTVATTVTAITVTAITVMATVVLTTVVIIGTVVITVVTAVTAPTTVDTAVTAPTTVDTAVTAPTTAVT